MMRLVAFLNYNWWYQSYLQRHHPVVWSAYSEIHTQTYSADKEDIHSVHTLYKIPDNC